ncbi:MAG: AraC family transcriptional regulator [Bacteroidales bacterium]|nr:AraC family transcriptional regulator [Bacteroidales bacterium]
MQKDTLSTRPHWSKDADYSRVPFFIRRMNTRGRITVAEVPSASLPLVGFLYLTEGEVLAEVDGIQFLCESGHLLLIPEGRPFAIRYYADAIGYTGGFRADLLSRPEVVLPWIEPVQQAFWFDEAVFVGELFNMLALSFEKGDVDFLAKGVDLLVSRVKAQPKERMPKMVSGFLESVFSTGRPPQDLPTYAAEAFVSPGHLNRTVKKATGKSVGAWIDIARLGMAKRLLRDTELPVSEVAVAVGLDDSSYFSRFFKLHVGLTPVAFRKKMHGLS